MNDVKKTTIFHRYDELDTRIMDYIYNQDITVMHLINKKLRLIAHRVTISKRIHKLKSLGIIRFVEETNPLCLTKNNDQEQLIKEMIDELKKKWRLI